MAVGGLARNPRCPIHGGGPINILELTDIPDDVTVSQVQGAARTLGLKAGFVVSEPSSPPTVVVLPSPDGPQEITVKRLSPLPVLTLGRWQVAPGQTAHMGHDSDLQPGVYEISVGERRFQFTV